MNTPSRSGWFGSRRGVEPVAMHQAVERDALAVVRASTVARRERRARSRARPSRQSSVEVVDALLAQHDVVGLGRRRASSSFDSGGRSYGRCGSAPIATMRPSKPSRRSVSAARSPASDIPTIATVCTHRGRDATNWPET